MTAAVRIAGRGLASALGPDLDSALRCLAAGGVVPAAIPAPPGPDMPQYRLDDDFADWHASARAHVRRVVADSGASAGPRTGPLLVGSSSVDVGAREHDGVFDGGYHALADRVAEWLDWRGPVMTLNTACTSSLNALLAAARWLRAGRADHALVLGVELRNRVSLGGFAGMQLLSPTRCRPLGRDRDGLVLGEAVAALHLRTEAPAGTAGWSVLGGANVVDGRDPAGAVPDAVEAMCARALADSRLAAGDIDLLKLQAAGSPVNDATELRGMQRVFRPLPPVVSMKACIGHTLGASGAAEIALLLACLDAGVWPRPDDAPDETLGVALASRAPDRTHHVLASILGFGGGHAAVALGKDAA